MTTGVRRLLETLPGAPLPLAHPLVEATAALESATAGSVQQARLAWVAELRRYAAGRGLTGEALLRDAWGLPGVPGADQAALALAAACLAASRSLVDGKVLRLALGPLDLAATLQPVVVQPAGSPPVVVGLLPPDGIAARLVAGPVHVDGGITRTPGGWTGTLGGTVGAVTTAAHAALRTEGGSSFVAILAAQMTPGIQIGLGFEVSTLGGVGCELAPLRFKDASHDPGDQGLDLITFGQGAGLERRGEVRLAAGVASDGGGGQPHGSPVRLGTL